jgi:hypothetical protein
MKEKSGKAAGDNTTEKCKQRVICGLLWKNIEKPT